MDPDTLHLSRGPFERVIDHAEHVRPPIVIFIAVAL
jgi:hypothetical protein